MLNGKVKWYSEIRGFGFIEMDNGEEVFVHRSGLQGIYGGLQEDQTVEFETKEGEKGLYAVNVKKTDKSIL
jgi:CspA family cold shock protein